MPLVTELLSEAISDRAFALIAVFLLLFGGIWFVKLAGRNFLRLQRKFLGQPSQCGLKSREVAQRLLQHAGIENVAIQVQTDLSFRSLYHPVQRKILLSPSIFSSASLAGLATAAHEVGHAVQYAPGKKLAWLRPVLAAIAYTSIGLAIVTMPFSVSQIDDQSLRIELAVLFVCLLSLAVTLYYEHDASRRAWSLACEAGLAQPGEGEAFRQFLASGWMTYLARTMQVGCTVVALFLLFRTQSISFEHDENESIVILATLFWPVVVAGCALWLNQRQSKPARTAADLSNVALNLLQEGECDAAIALLNHALRYSPRTAMLYINRAVCYQRRGSLDAALADLQYAIDLEPAGARQRLQRASIYFAQQKHEQALIDLDRSLQGPRKDLAGAQLLLGNILFDQGRFERAIRTFSAALEHGCDRWTALCSRSLAYLKQGKLEYALADSEEAIQLAPQAAIGYNNRGAVFTKIGNYAKAVADFEAAKALDPQLPNSFKNLAWIKATCPEPEFRDGDEAVALANRALDLMGEKGVDWLDIVAAAYAEAGDFRRAVEYQEQFLVKCPKQQQEEQQQRLKLYQASQPWRETLDVIAVDG